MFGLLCRLLTVFLIPCFTLYAVDAPTAAPTPPPITAATPQLQIDMPFTYDDVVGLLDDIENDNLEEKYTPDQVVEIIHFLIHLARLGILPDEDPNELEADIQELLSSLEEEPVFTFAPSVPREGFMFAPALYGDYGHIFLCKKGFFHRCTDHTKHFFC